MPRRWPFLTSCVNVPPEDVKALLFMIEHARQISFRTFVRVADWQATAYALGYNRIKLVNGKVMALKNEPHVGFYKSSYKGRPCVFFRHSAIEYIFQARPEVYRVELHTPEAS